MPTLYRCDGYNEEECEDCSAGIPHEFDAIMCGEWDCSVQGKIRCMEYDNGLPCNIPDCPEHTGGDGESCNS